MKARPASPPRPFLSLRPRAVGPVVLLCEHAGRRIPSDRKGEETAASRAIVSSHWGWDIGAWSLTRELSSRLSVSAVGGRWSRLVVDLNRAPDAPDLVRRSAGGADLPWNLRLTTAEVERRVRDYYLPYHEEADRRIARHVIRAVRPLVLSVHTFTPDLDGERRDFDAGVLHGNGHEALARRLAAVLRREGLSVRLNEPYSGLEGLIYSAERHASHLHLRCLELEVNQGLLEPKIATRARLAAAVARSLTRVLREPVR